MKEFDFQLHYEEKGSGSPLVFLHGNGEDSSYFDCQTEYFSRTRRVIAVDTRGHGKSARGLAPFTIRQFAEDLYALSERLRLPKFDLLGFSDGANIAMIFAMKYPEKVNKLILNGANLNGNGIKPQVQIPIKIGYFIAKQFSKRSEKALKNAELLGLMVNDPNVPAEELQKITAKTLVVAGTKDMVRKKHTLLIARSIPHSQTVLIRGDHFIAKKNSGAFNDSAERFLNEP